MNHTATTVAVISTVYIGGFFGLRFVMALLEHATAWPYGVGLFALILLTQSLREINGSC